MTDIRVRLLKGTFWISGARVVSNLLGLVGTLVVARLLVPADFGLVALGTTILAIVTAITDIPISEALVQHRNPTPAHFHTAWTISLVRSTVIAIVIAAAASPTAIFYHDSRLFGIIAALSVGVVLGGVSNPRAIMLTKDLVFWQQFVLQVAQKLTSSVVTIVVAFASRSYWALIVGTIAGQAVGVLVSYTVLPFRPRFALKHGRELMSFSVWLTFCQVVNTLNFKLDQLLIGTLLGNAQLGFYTVGDNLAVIPSREATLPLTATLFPAFSRLGADRSRLAPAYQSAQALVTAVALPAGVGVALIADPLIRLTLGQKWAPAIFIVQALAAVFAFQTLGSLAQPLAMAAGKTRLLFRRDLQALAFRVPILIIGVYLGGLHGIVYARVFTGTTAGLFLNTSVVTHITGLSFMQQIGVNVRSLVSATVMAGSVALSSALITHSHMNSVEEILLLSFIGLTVYLSATAILWKLMGRPTGPETEFISMISKLTPFTRRRNLISEVVP